MKRILLILSAISGLLATTLVARAAPVFIIQNNYGAQDAGFHLLTSDPYNYQKLSPGPQAIVITFSQPIDVATSSILIYDLYGSQINGGQVKSEGNRMVVDLPQPLSAGPYKVKWKAQCHCPDQTQINDVFRFTVR